MNAHPAPPLEVHSASLGVWIWVVVALAIVVIWWLSVASRR
jgi:hypothetical protein